MTISRTPVFSKNAPLWALAFRPFFLFGSLFSMAGIFLWLAFLSGGMATPGYLNPLLWHAHEMIFGFSTAIIGGFVLTAAQNWTGLRGVHGPKLQLIFALWLLARVLIFFSVIRFHHPNLLTAVVDLGFFPALAFCMFPYLKDPELKIERIFLLYFLLFFAGNALIHLESFGAIHGLALKGIFLGLHTVILVIVFMGGRVIPFFTESSIAKAQPRTKPWVEVLSHASAWLFLLTQFFAPTSLLAAVIALVAGAVHFLRLWGWQVRRVRRIPLIWILHLAYGWIALGFLLTGLASLERIAISIGVHAFTVGGLGVIIYGMMTRVSLGHTARRLHPSSAIVVGYYLLNLSAAVRVLGPLVAPNLYLGALKISGELWILAFGVFVFVYFPMLIRPRLDGRPG